METAIAEANAIRRGSAAKCRRDGPNEGALRRLPNREGAAAVGRRGGVHPRCKHSGAEGCIGVRAAKSSSKAGVTASGEGGTPAKVVESKLEKAIASLVSVMMDLQGMVVAILW
jgi:hypothetical protein